MRAVVERGNVPPGGRSNKSHGPVATPMAEFTSASSFAAPAAHASIAPPIPKRFAPHVCIAVLLARARHMGLLLLRPDGSLDLGLGGPVVLSEKLTLRAAEDLISALVTDRYLNCWRGGVMVKAEGKPRMFSECGGKA